MAALSASAVAEALRHRFTAGLVYALVGLAVYGVYDLANLAAALGVGWGSSFWRFGFGGPLLKSPLFKSEEGGAVVSTPDLTQQPPARPTRHVGGDARLIEESEQEGLERTH